MRNTLATYAAAAVLALAGCAARPPALPKPTATTNLTLVASTRSMQGNINRGTALHLVLPPPAKPGTKWELVSNDERILHQLTDLLPTAAGGVEVSFQAVHLGHSVVRFAALNPNQSESTPTDVFQVAVQVDEP